MTSPFVLAQFIRDLWGRYDPVAIAQLAGLAEDKCYQPKFYKAPAISQELMAAKSYVPYGLKITPGAILYGWYLPVPADTDTPYQFSLQVTDQSLQHQFWSEAIPATFISNFLGTSQHNILALKGTFPSLLRHPYAITGDGLFQVELWETSGSQQRVEVVIGAFEPIDPIEALS
jgi:hypothetical protein